MISHNFLLFLTLCGTGYSQAIIITINIKDNKERTLLKKEVETESKYKIRFHFDIFFSPLPATDVNVAKCPLQDMSFRTRTSKYSEVR